MNTKVSYHYVPFPSDFFFDDRIILLESKFGYSGTALVTKMRIRIFSGPFGYKIKWDEDIAAIFAVRIMGGKSSAEEVQEMVNYLLEKGYYDKDFYEKRGFLTSQSIQQEWMILQEKQKRTITTIPPEDDVCGLSKGDNSELSRDNSTFGGDNSELSPRKKERKK